MPYTDEQGSEDPHRSLGLFQIGERLFTEGGGPGTATGAAGGGKAASATGAGNGAGTAAGGGIGAGGGGGVWELAKDKSIDHSRWFNPVLDQKQVRVWAT